LVDDDARGVVSALTEAAIATTFDLLTFLVMPDHVHVLAQGASDDSNAIRLMQRFKQLAGFRYKQRFGRELWQHSFYDRVLRRDEDLLTVAKYILGNPIRAGLIAADGVWPFQGGALFEGVVDDEPPAANAALTGAEAPPLRDSDDRLPIGAGKGALRELGGDKPTGAEAPPLRELRDRNTAPCASDTETSS
jgi:REP element-mobilizing transposase RayT